jgi:hypothetical protein
VQGRPGGQEGLAARTARWRRDRALGRTPLRVIERRAMRGCGGGFQVAPNGRPFCIGRQQSCGYAGYAGYVPRQSEWAEPFVSAGSIPRIPRIPRTASVVPSPSRGMADV